MAPGRVAHEPVDTGADAQPGTGRYTRSHSTGLYNDDDDGGGDDVFNNMGDTGDLSADRRW